MAFIFIFLIVQAEF
uniref:Uncharacterized protein n=1 Tax=Rhizophora mucronata TaxID=61149 RepID=A0A2P2KLU2_RHIMU